MELIDANREKRIDKLFRLIVLTMFLLFMINACINQVVAIYEDRPVMEATYEP